MISYNLVDRPWIPCRMADGAGPVLLGLQDVLLRASEIREISAESPVVTASLHRLLLAILHRNFGPSGAREWANLWEAGRFETARIVEYLARWRSRFDLFDEVRPFYQCASLSKADKKPIAQMAPELASGNNATLFDHSTSGL